MSGPTRREFFHTSVAVAAVVGLNASGSATTEGMPALRPSVAVVARGRAGERMTKLFLSDANGVVSRVAGVRVSDKSLRVKGQWKTVASQWLKDAHVSAVAISVPGRWPLRYVFAALEAGKDVYLDPLRGYATTDIRELDAVARRTGRIVYLATPHRANPGLCDAIAAVKTGAIGVVRSARAVCLRAPNDSVDPFGSAGWSSRVVRATDLAVWALGDTPPSRVLTAGFTTRPQPAAALPENVVAAFTHGHITLTLEQSAIAGPLPDGIAKPGVGAIIEGTAGRLTLSETGAVLCAPDGTVTRRFSGTPNPVGAFLRAVASRSLNLPSWSGAAAVQFAADADQSAEPVIGSLPAIVSASVATLRQRADSAGFIPSTIRVGMLSLS